MAALSATSTDQLQALRLAVEEIHSRREDGWNDFTKDESAVGRFVRSLDVILRERTHDAGGAMLFLDTAVQSFDASPLVMDPLQRAQNRHLATNDETFRLWLIFALSCHGSLLETLTHVLQMEDLLLAFYLETSPLLLKSFRQQFLALVASATMHPVQGPTTFKLDIQALPLFQAPEEQIVVRRRAGTVKGKSATAAGASTAAPGGAAAASGVPPRRKRVPTGAAGHADPSDNLDATATSVLSEHADASVSQHATPRHPRHHAASVSTSEAEVQTDASGALSSSGTTATAASSSSVKGKMVNRDTMTDDPAPSKTYDELKQLERLVAQRERVNRETAERLQREEELLGEARHDVDDQLDNLTTVLRNLKALYNHHFLLVKDCQDSGKPIDRNRVDALFPSIVAVLNGADPALHSGGMTPAPSTGNFGRKPSSGELSASSSPAQGGPGDGFEPGLQPRIDSFVLPRDGGSDAGMRNRSMSVSVLPPPDSAPVVPRGSRPWRTDMLTERDRPQQLEVQHYRCAACHKDLPNVANSNFLAKAIQRTAKPRRCHYSGELYCHDCHSNKKFVLPFLAVQRWDFTEMHVSNRDYDFLQEHFTKPMINISELPRDLQSRSVVVRAVKLRSNLSKMYATLYTCPDARTSFGSQIAHYYFSTDSYFSVSDLLSLRNREEAENPAAARGKAVVGTVNRFLLGHHGMDLLAALEGLVKSGREHILDKCHHCRSRAVTKCTLCGDADPVIMFENGVLCKDCQRPFHRTCLALGCSECEARRRAGRANNI
jgi:hypothetical protein